MTELKIEEKEIQIECLQKSVDKLSKEKEALRGKIKSMGEILDERARKIVFLRRSNAGYKGRIRTLQNEIKRLCEENDRHIENMASGVDKVQRLEELLHDKSKECERYKKAYEQLLGLPWYKRLFA